MPTIRDVARKAHVSTATVSATLNRTAFVSQELRERVLKAVHELGYSPDAIARSLKQGRTGLIGLVVADITNPYFTELTQVVEGTAQEEGYTVLLCDTNQDPSKEHEYLRLLRTYRVEGLILAPTGSLDHYDPIEMAAFRIPIVLVDRLLPSLPFDSVALDNVLAAKVATRHILEFGHRRVGMIGGPEHLSAAHDRREGYRIALQEFRVAYDAHLVRDGRFREEDAFVVCRDLLSKEDRPTALFVANNHMLIGVMRALADFGLRCPHDISVVSIDDFPWANAFSPRLTTVSQPVTEIGQTAVRLLLNRLAGKAPDEIIRVTMQPRLLARDSCSPLAPGPTPRRPARGKPKRPMALPS